MTGYDVHMDKAIKELRARLDQAERERGQLHGALRNVLAALGNGSGATPNASVEFMVNTWHEVLAVVGELRRERDEARRERDEARASAIRVGEERDAALRSLGRTQTALDEERRTCTKALQERDEARAALAAAVAAEREACAQMVDCMHGPACADPECRYARDARTIRARATSPAPEPAPWDSPTPKCDQALRDAAARKGGG